MTIQAKNGSTVHFTVMLYDSVDGKTPKTGAAITGTITKNGGAYAAISGSIAELAAGAYDVSLDGTDTNTNGTISFHGTASGADNVDAVNVVQVVAYDPVDTVRLGLTALPNAAAEAAGGLYTRGSGAGQINQPANGMVDINAVRHLGTAYPAPTVAGIPKVEEATLRTTIGTPVGASISADIAAVKAETLRTLGLLHENSRDDNHVYSGSNLTQFRKRVFASKAAREASTAGAADNADGEIARYTINLAYTGSNLTGFTWDREL